MASIGSVVSTAVTGGDAPVFESTAEIKALTKQANKTGQSVDETNERIARLEALIEKLVERDSPVAVEEAVAPATKAKATKA